MAICRVKPKCSETDLRLATSSKNPPWNIVVLNSGFRGKKLDVAGSVYIVNFVVSVERVLDYSDVV